MKKLILSAAVLLAAGYAHACDYCVGNVVAPVVVQYRQVQPQIVRETVTVERQTVQRDPVIVERRELVQEYPAPVVGAYVAPVVGYRQPLTSYHGGTILRESASYGGHHGGAIVAPRVVVAPQIVAKKEVVRSGLFGRRIVQKSVTVVK